MAAQMDEGEEEVAEAFLNMAREYRSAAATLLSVDQRATNPLYFLLGHAVELSLKAYLRASGRPAPRGQRGHAITKLVEQCAGCGLAVDLDLQNIAHLLDCEGKVHGFRYFAFKSAVRPDIDYLGEVVDRLLAVVEPKVAASPTLSAPGAVLKFIVGKQEKKVI